MAAQTSGQVNVVLLDCSEGCEGGHYAAGLNGGTCHVCGNPVLWADIVPNLDEGEAPAVVQDPASPSGAWLAVRLADDTRGE